MINAARLLISGDGELDNGWKRLLGINNGRPSLCGTGVDSSPSGLRYSGGSFLAVCPCCPNPSEEAALLPKICGYVCALDCVVEGFLRHIFWPVEMFLRPPVKREGRNVHRDLRGAD